MCIMNTHVYVYIYIYIYTHISLSLYIYIYIYMYTHLSARLAGTSEFGQAYRWICMCIYIYIYRERERVHCRWWLFTIVRFLVLLCFAFEFGAGSATSYPPPRAPGTAKTLPYLLSGGTTLSKRYSSNAASFGFCGVTCLIRLIEFAALFATVEEPMC